MERLTIRDKNGEAHMICKQMCGDYGHQCDGQIDVDMCQRYVAFDKLAEYEDLEEQCLLLKLPCKDVFYIVDKGTKYEMVMSKSIDNLNLYEIRGIDKDGYYWSTRKLAEERLKESGG